MKSDSAMLRPDKTPLEWIESTLDVSAQGTPIKTFTSFYPQVVPPLPNQRMRTKPFGFEIMIPCNTYPKYSLGYSLSMKATDDGYPSIIRGHKVGP